MVESYCNYDLTTEISQYYALATCDYPAQYDGILREFKFSTIELNFSFQELLVNMIIILVI